MLMCLYGCLFVLTPSADHLKSLEHLHCRLSKKSQAYGESTIHESNVRDESFTQPVRVPTGDMEMGPWSCSFSPWMRAESVKLRASSAIPEPTVTEIERLVAMERELQKSGMSFGEAANKDCCYAGIPT
jgi:hypothetical protein